MNSFLAVFFLVSALFAQQTFARASLKQPSSASIATELTKMDGFSKGIKLEMVKQFGMTFVNTAVELGKHIYADRENFGQNQTACDLCKKFVPDVDKMVVQDGFKFVSYVDQICPLVSPPWIEGCKEFAMDLHMLIVEMHADMQDEKEFCEEIGLCQGRHQ